jgi:hypothetical protein
MVVVVEKARCNGAILKNCDCRREMVDDVSGVLEQSKNLVVLANMDGEKTCSHAVFMSMHCGTKTAPRWNRGVSRRQMRGRWLTGSRVKL